MGTLGHHWTFLERLRWMLWGKSPNRNLLGEEIKRLRNDWTETNLQIIDLQATHQGRLDKIAFLEHEVER